MTLEKEKEEEEVQEKRFPRLTKTLEDESMELLNPPSHHDRPAPGDTHTRTTGGVAGFGDACFQSQPSRKTTSLRSDSSPDQVQGPAWQFSEELFSFVFSK